MDFLKRTALVLFSLYGFVVFLALMLILFPAVIISSLFGKIRGGNLIYRICRLWADLAFFFWGIRHTNIYESPHNRQLPMVFVFNHISYMDIPMLMKAIRRQPVRVLGKAELGRIPIFGFIYRNAAIMVDRSNAAARAESIRKMIEMLEMNISIMLAPEGTFNTTHRPLKSFFDGAFRIAIETQTPIKPVIFPDGYDRLGYKSVFSLTPGRSRAVFLAEVETKGLTLNDLETLKQTVYDKMADALIRYRASWITDGQ